ncbi:MAG: MotA/TolQ/ExbB proton channel family protein [Planctomycetota bacterium]
MLLVPVVAALVGLIAYALLMVGGFLRELVDRRGAALLDFAHSKGAQSGTQRLAAAVVRTDLPGMVGRFAAKARSAGNDRAWLAAVATQCEVEASRRVSRLNLVARAGPTLGLMATLIPMGPALLALADNDVSTLARSLVVAFTATVCGLLVGLLCSTMGSVRRHWYAADLALVDELLETAGEVRP